MKRRFLLLTAFALMALLTPLGAKGHETQEPDRALSVEGARLRAGLNTSVTFGGYVNFKGVNQFFVQDNYTYPDGAGLLVYCDNVSHANINQVRVGTYVRITATKVSYSTLDGGSVYIDTHDYGAIEIVSQDNELAVQDVTLQQLKDAHYPLSNKLISDHYQYRLVRLTNLQVVGYQQGYGYFVEDLNHVRDTIRCNESLNLNDWQGISELVAIDNRDNHIYTYGSLLVRFSDDVTTYFSLSQARHLAGANMPVKICGLVTCKEGQANGYSIQSTESGGITYGIKLSGGDNVHLSVGDMVVIDANHVDFTPSGVIYIYSISSYRVVGNNLPFTARNVTLETLKSSHYPATPSRIMNDSWQHTLVKLSNLTVIGHPDYPYTNNDYIVENANGIRDTLTLNYYMDLPAGQQLASVTAVNCRESGIGRCTKLYVPNMEDIQFPSPRTIHYARTHLDQTHVVEGVINYVGPIGNYGWAYASIQDNTGGLEIRLYPPFPTVGDRVIMQVRPVNESGNLIESLDNAIISTLDHNAILPRANTDIATLYQQNQSNPGNGRYEGCLIQLQNAVVLDLHTDRFSIYQNGNEDQAIEVYYKALPTADREYLYSQLDNGALILNVVGAKFITPTTPSDHYINLRSLDDIELPEPHDINLSVYPSELNGSIFTATLSQSGGEAITEAAAGQRVYLHLSTTTPDNPSTINYLKSSNANYSKLMHHSTLCTSDSNLQLTRVNSTCWSFVMPNEDVYMEALFTPTPNYGAICSDVWEAREGASDNNEEAPLVFLRGVVTLNNVYIVRIQDAFNQNCSSDELKKYCGIKCDFDYNYHLQRGDNVIVCGRARTFNDGTRLSLDNPRVLSTGNWGYVEHPRPTTLA